jgi:hypothetical protein
VIDGDIVSAIRDLASRRVGSKTIAKQLGVARNTVRRYRREPVLAGVPTNLDGVYRIVFEKPAHRSPVPGASPAPSEDNNPDPDD